MLLLRVITIKHAQLVCIEFSSYLFHQEPGSEVMLQVCTGQMEKGSHVEEV